LSCQKHLDTRLVKYRLPKDSYCGWKVIYVVGDLSIDSSYDLRGDMLYVKCEDSYIHLLKKFVLSIKYLHALFKITEGVLRCGDDLIFNESRLEQFLGSHKADFLGRAFTNQSYYSSDTSVLKKLTHDPLMESYYQNHMEDFSNPMHNLLDLSVEKLRKYATRPHVWGPAGVIYYLSNKACSILVEHMEDISFDVFHFDEFTKSYPYTIEDCAVTYIMYFHCIPFTHYYHMFDTHEAIVCHTNEFK